MVNNQRRVISAAQMQALAHPLRLRLLDLLVAEGAFTASEAARRLGETPANVSWHLRKLAREGFVRQSVDAGRARPWRYVGQALSVGGEDTQSAVGVAVTDVLHEREFQLLRAALRAQDREAQPWRAAATVVQSRLWLTSAEAEELGQRLGALLRDERLLERNQDPALRPAGARPMALMGWAVPMGDPVGAEGQPSPSDIP